MRDLTVLTVDDEPLSLLRLEQALPSIAGVAHVGAAFGCAEGLDKIKTLQPDIVLLDIRLRDGTGFDLVEQLPRECRSEIIFVTAYDEFAAKAFATNAVDYVMKPVSSGRLTAAIERARERIETRGARAQLGELQDLVGELKRALREGRPREGEPAFWIRNRGGDLVSLHAEEVDCVRSEDDYVRLITAHGQYLMRGSIRALMPKIGESKFIRVHRNALVRRAAIQRVHRAALGAVEVELASGIRIRAGRVFAKQLLQDLRLSTATLHP